MDKSTATLAEEVGLFLVPMMRAMIVTAFKESGLAAKIELMSAAHTALVERVQDFAVATQAALVEHATKIKSMQTMQDLNNVELERRVDGQLALQDQLSGKAGADALAALEVSHKALSEQLQAFTSNAQSRLSDVEFQQRQLDGALQTQAERLVDQLAGKAGVEVVDRQAAAHEVLAQELGQYKLAAGGALREEVEARMTLARMVNANAVALDAEHEGALRAVEDVRNSVSVVRSTVDELNDTVTAIPASVVAVSKLVEGLEERVAGLAVAQDAGHTSLLNVAADLEASINRVREAIPPAPPTVFEVVDSCKGLMADVVEGAVQPAVRDAVQQAVAAIPPAKQGDPGPVGLMPMAENYIEGRIYERAAVVLFAGGAWQATRATKTQPAPAMADWQPLIVGVAGLAVQPSDDARSVELKATLSDGTVQNNSAVLPSMIYRGVFDPEAKYIQGDVVTFDGSMWHAEKACTGYTPNVSPDVWRLAVKCGKPGGKGKDGVDGTIFKVGFAGEYEENKVYPTNSIVTYASSVWLAKRPTKDRPPYMTNADNEHWLRVR